MVSHMSKQLAIKYLNINSCDNGFHIINLSLCIFTSPDYGFLQKPKHNINIVVTDDFLFHIDSHSYSVNFKQTNKVSEYLTFAGPSGRAV